MIYEGVNFVVEVCKGMTKAQFIKAHLRIFWKDRDEATRKKMLDEAWALIKKSPEKAD